VLDERTRDEEARARDLPLVDAIADFEDVVQLRAEIARERHSALEELLGRGGHDLPAEAGAVCRVPVLVVSVADDHQVHVHVGEPGQNAHPARVDGRRPIGHRDGRTRTDRDDPLARDQHDAVVDRRALVAVDDPSADERERRFGRRLGGGQARAERDTEDESAGEPAHVPSFRKARILAPRRRRPAH